MKDWCEFLSKGGSIPKTVSMACVRPQHVGLLGGDWARRGLGRRADGRTDGSLPGELGLMCVLR